MRLRSLTWPSLLAEALRSDEGIADWVYSAKAGDTLEGSGEDYDTGWTCSISIRCIASASEEDLKKEFEEELKISPLGPGEDYEEAFEDWLRERDEDEQVFEMDYTSVENLVDPTNRITYDQLRAMNASAAYDFGQFWSPHEPGIEIYGATEQEDQFAVVKRGATWVWEDDQWTKTSEPEIRYMKDNTSTDLSANEVLEILEDYTDKAF